MTPATQNKLRAAWHSSSTAQQIARRHHLGSVRALNRFWAKEKAAGRLPDRPRPHFVECTHVAVVPLDMADLDMADLDMADPGAAVDAVADLALDREIARAEAMPDNEADPRYAAQLYGCRISDGDPLLAALKRVHGNDPRRRFDTAGHDDRARTPSAHHCAAQRRFRDRAMTIVALHPQRFSERPAS
jgi:hypothetical protein